MILLFKFENFKGHPILYSFTYLHKYGVIF